MKVITMPSSYQRPQVCKLATFAAKYIGAFVILLLVCQPLALGIHLEIRKPINDSIIGNDFTYQISIHGAAERLRRSEIAMSLDTVTYPHENLFNGLVTSEAMTMQVNYPIVHTGRNIFKATLFDPKTREVLHAIETHIHVNSVPFRLKAWIDGAKSSTPTREYFSYALVAFSPKVHRVMLESFLMLNPRRIEFFSSTGNGDHDNRDAYELFRKTTDISVFHRNIDCSNVGAVDQSIISMDGLYAAWRGQNEFTDVVEYVHQHVLKYLSITRDTVWFFCPTEHHALMEALRTRIKGRCSMDMLHVQMSADATEVVDEFAPGMHIWRGLRSDAQRLVGDVGDEWAAHTFGTGATTGDISNVDSLARESVDDSVYTNSYTDKHTDRHTDIFTDKWMHTRKNLYDLSAFGHINTVLEMANYDVSRSFMLLRHACVTEDRLLVMFNNDSDTTAETYAPIFDGEYLVASEDRGFQYIGMPTTELPAGGEDVQRVVSRWHTYEGLTALSQGVQPGHLIHETEPLTQLLYAAWTLMSECAGGRDIFDMKGAKNTKLSQQEAHSRRLDRMYAHILSHVRRLVLVTASSGTVGDWVSSFAECVMGYLRKFYDRCIYSEYTDCHSSATAGQCMNETTSITSSNAVSRGRLETRTAGGTYTYRRPDPTQPASSDAMLRTSLMYKEHLFFQSHEQQQLPLKGACFERLLLLGRANSHIAYFGSKQLARSFREYVYSLPKVNVALASLPQGAGDPAADPAGGQGEYYRQRKMKVTIVMKSGKSRSILNIDDIIRVIKRSGSVDEQWLDSHMLVFETLSFSEQVQIMAHTDVFVGVHGAALFNGIFMQEGSAVLEIMNGPFAEHFFNTPLREAGVGIMTVPVTDYTTQCAGCLEMIAEDGYELPPQCHPGSPGFDSVEGARLECIMLRRCSVEVNLDLFRAKFTEASLYVMAEKFYSLPKEKGQ
jgi:hypothetical protein